MKKFIALLLALVMAVSLIACAKAPAEPEVEEPAPETEEVAPETEEAPEEEVEPEAEPEVEEPAEPEAEPQPEVEEPQAEEPEVETEPEMEAAANGATDILNTIWASMPEEALFPAAGGDENNMVMDGPGVVELTSTDFVTNILLVPAELQSGITEIGNLMHMMNANTFTAGVFGLADGTAAADFAAAMEERITTNQWMCGFPDTLQIFDLGGHVLVAFGNADIMNAFGAQVLASYPDAAELVNVPLA